MLVERDVELTTIRQSFNESLAGRGRVILASGPAGIGKTGLLRTLTAEAIQHGATLLRAVGSRAESRLPFGVVGQLLAGADLLPEDTRWATRLFEDGELNAMLHGSDSEAADQVNGHVLAGLTTMVLNLSQRAPLLVSIDDAHHADVASLQWLLYLLRRIDRARILVVVTENTSVRQARPMFWAELASQAQCRHVRLGPLSSAGVAEMLRRRLDDGEGERLRANCHDISGGNPLFVTALIEDGLGDPVTHAGDAYARTVITTLYRSDPMLLRLARILAVLDEPASVATLKELTGLDGVSIAWTLEAATDAGLLRDGRFRHQRARTAVLEATTPEERGALHEAVANLLYDNGAPAVTVARHGIAARQVGASWSAPVLHEAAEQALKEDDHGLALACLRLAEKDTAAEPDEAKIKSTLVRAKWRINPMTAERDVSGLLAAHRAGHLDVHHAIPLVKCLQWYGRVHEAVEAYDRVTSMVRATHPGERTMAAVQQLGMGLAFNFPGVSYTARYPLPESPERPETAGAENPTTNVLVSDLLTRGVTENALTEAERVLQQSRLDDSTWEAIVLSLTALVIAERLDAAAHWCDVLLKHAEGRRVPTWCSVLSAIRGMVSLRQGALPEAQRYARASLSYVPAKGLGVFLGAPLSVLLSAAIRSGNHEQVATQLGVPVPEAMFQTPIGLQYLSARGRYYLTRQQYAMAIAELERCGDLMIKWGLDVPGIAPWRTDLAEAYLNLGEERRAQELAREQLAQLGPYNERTRGISLRVLAATTADPRQRSAILRKAVDMLQDSGDRLELLTALNALSDAQTAAGEHESARLTAHRAHQVKHRYQALFPDEMAARRNASAHAPTDASAEAPTGTPTEPPTGARHRAEPDPVYELSNAERRVAALAARGKTNRQIARTLFVTVSTVEQHLTSTYRKLGVRRRADLPLSLVSLAGLGDSA